MTFAGTRVRLNQGAASADHAKAGVRASRTTKAASRATGLRHNRNPLVRNLHPLFPNRATNRENPLQDRYNILCIHRQGCPTGCPQPLVGPWANYWTLPTEFTIFLAVASKAGSFKSIS
jgi:hypothetical protein